jgi:group I intron endonuclease
MSYYLKKCCGIYCITHTESGRQYVGQSLNCVDRWRQHTTPRKGSTGIKGAIMKYGVSAFTFSVLEECKREELNEREIWWIAELSTLAPSGFNLTTGGGAGTTVSDKTREKLRAGAKGRAPASVESRAKMSDAKKGRTLSAEHRANIGAMSKGNQNTKGKTHSDETRAKMSAAQKGRTLSDETRAKLSAAAKERERLKREES